MECFGPRTNTIFLHKTRVWERFERFAPLLEDGTTPNSK